MKPSNRFRVCAKHSQSSPQAFARTNYSDTKNCNTLPNIILRLSHNILPGSLLHVNDSHFNLT